MKDKSSTTIIYLFTQPNLISIELDHNNKKYLVNLAKKESKFILNNIEKTNKLLQLENKIYKFEIKYIKEPKNIYGEDSEIDRMDDIIQCIPDEKSLIRLLSTQGFNRFKKALNIKDIEELDDIESALKLDTFMYLTTYNPKMHLGFLLFNDKRDLVTTNIDKMINVIKKEMKGI